MLQVEILSEEYPHNLEMMPLSDIGYQIDEGDWSGSIKTVTFAKPITGKRAANAVKAQGSDPEFFQMDDKGNEIED